MRSGAQCRHSRGIAPSPPTSRPSPLPRHSPPSSRRRSALSDLRSPRRRRPRELRLHPGPASSRPTATGMRYHPTGRIAMTTLGPATFDLEAALAARTLRAPRGTRIRCKGWLQEAAFRMLCNNLDPEVAERPQDLVVYGGSGKAARNWDALAVILRTLERLDDDETLL